MALLPPTNQDTFFSRRIEPREAWFGMTWAAIYEEALKDYSARHHVRYKVATTLRVLIALPVGVLSLLPCLIQFFRSNKSLGLFHLLFDINRDIAVWVVYVPTTKLRCHGGVKGVLVPTRAPKFAEPQRKNIKQGEDIKDRILKERDHLLTMLRELTKARRNDLERFNTKLIASEVKVDDDVKYDLRVAQAEIDDFDKRVQLFNRMKAHLDYVETKLREITELSETLECQTRTGYRGISDWAKDTEDSYHNLFTAVSGVAFVGAGLTYASIFSATRGNIGLMSWAFSLFVVSLVVSLTVQSLLMWCSQLPARHPFVTSKGWEVVIAVCVFGACTATVASITILVWTVFRLQWNLGATADGDAGNGQNPPQDSPLVYDVEPRPSAILAFATIGLGVFVVLLVFVLYGMANGVEDLVWRRAHSAKKKSGLTKTTRKKLVDFDL